MPSQSRHQQPRLGDGEAKAVTSAPELTQGLSDIRDLAGRVGEGVALLPLARDRVKSLSQPQWVQQGNAGRLFVQSLALQAQACGNGNRGS